MGGGHYSEVYYNMGKRLGLKVNGRYREVSAIRRWPHLEAGLQIRKLFSAGFFYMRDGYATKQLSITAGGSGGFFGFWTF